MNDLISRLEAATGPDPELDAQIYCAIYKSCFPDETYEQHLAYARRAEPGYTKSIDTTLELLRPGWSWRVGNLPSGRGFADLGTQPSLQCIEGATPAIALCTAILKARAQQHDNRIAPSTGKQEP